MEGVSTAAGVQWRYSFLKSLLANCTPLCLSSPVPHVPQGAEQGELQHLEQGGSCCTSQLYSTSTVLSPWSPEVLSALLHHENTELDSSLCSENVFWKPQVKNYFNFHFITPFAASLWAASEILITLKVTDKNPSNWKPQRSQNFTFYELNFSHFGWYLLLLSGITAFDYVQSTTSCSLQLQPFCAIIQLTANNSALDMTGLLSDLESRRGSWLEFQPGMLSCRQPAQKFISACEFRVAHEKHSFPNNTLVLSSIMN